MSVRANYQISELQREHKNEALQCVCLYCILFATQVLFNEHVLFLFSLYNNAPFYSVFSSSSFVISSTGIFARNSEKSNNQLRQP